jgi:hypothetical protein
MLSKWPVLILASLTISCVSSCGTSTSVNSLVCGPEQFVSFGNVLYYPDTLTPASPNFYLATPHTAPSHCYADFILQYEWADSARRVNDATQPPAHGSP